MLQVLQNVKNKLNTFRNLKISSKMEIKEKKQLYVRLIFTIKRYIQFNIKRNMIFENTHFTFIGMFFIFLLIYFMTPPITTKVSVGMKLLVDRLLLIDGLQGFGDKTIRYTITTVTNSMALVLSILSAMYIFTHREQKTVSPSVSNFNKKNGLVVAVVILIIIVMIEGHTLNANMDSLMKQSQYIHQHAFHVTKVLFIRISIWIVSIFFASVFVIELIKYLFMSMNAAIMLKNSILEVSNNLEVLTSLYIHKRFERLLEDSYSTLHHNIESIFQYLKFLGDNNMNKDFDDNVADLSNVINILKKNENNYNVASYLLDRDREHFLGIYNSFLRNNLSIITHLYKNNYFNKGKKLTSLYFSNYLNGEDSLKQLFILSLNEFLDSLDTSNERQLKDFLNGLKDLPEDSTLIIYKNLIQKLIVKKNLEAITGVVSGFKNHLIQEHTNQPQQRSANMFQAIAAQNQNNLKKSAIVILLQSLVKSIEISQYGISGFLVKYLVTNFSGEDINGAYQRLKLRPNSFTTIVENSKEQTINNEQDKEIGLVGINPETFDYCCKKMCILLYGQQQYAIKEKLWFVKETESFQMPIALGEEFENCSYSNYVMKKLTSASSKFGLLFFHDMEIIDKINQTLQISQLSEEKELQPLN